MNGIMTSVFIKSLFWLKIFVECAWVCLYAVPIAIFHLAFRRQKNISGKVALVTGAARHLGREIALELSRHGCTVICVDVNAEGNKKTAQDVVKQGGKSREFTCDITDSTAVADLSKKAGPVDILINNAGLITIGPFLEMTEVTVTKAIDVNITSQFRMIRAFLPGMLERDSGHIVGIASCAGLAGLPNATLYSTTKFAVVGLMTTLAEELRVGGHNRIKMSCVCPFFVKTIPEMCTEVVSRLPSLETVDAARDIVSGVRQELPFFTVPRHMEMLLKALSLFPNTVAENLRDVFNIHTRPGCIINFPASNEMHKIK